MKGKILVTGKIELESDESQWRMLIGGLIDELKTSGIINSCDGRRVRLKLHIKTAIPPEDMDNEALSPNLTTNLDSQISTGFIEIHRHLMKHLYEKLWIFVGCINGNESKPIMIQYYPGIKTFIYTQKLVKTEVEAFFPGERLN